MAGWPGRIFELLDFSGIAAEARSRLCWNRDGFAGIVGFSPNAAASVDGILGAVSAVSLTGSGTVSTGFASP